jgi:hypothetical protein
MTTVEVAQFLVLLMLGTGILRLLAHWLRNTSFGAAFAFVTP